MKNKNKISNIKETLYFLTNEENKYINSGYGKILQSEIANQCYPKTHIKIHQLWRWIDQLNVLQIDFKDLLIEIVNDKVIISSTDRETT